MARRSLVLIALLSATVAGAAPEPTVRPLPPLVSTTHGVDGSQVTSTTAAPASSDSDDVYYDSGPARYIDKQKMWQMTGGVTLNQGDTYLKTQAALVDLDKDLGAQDAKSLAPVHLYDDQNDVTADHATIDFKTHIATLTDHITLIARPGKAKPGSLQSQSKTPATVTCDTIIYDYRHKTGHIPSPLTIRQKDRVLTADTGDYDGNAKTVTLIGHVKGMQSDGSTISTDKLIAGIAEDDQWIYIPGPIHALLKVKKQDNGTPGSKPTPQPAPPPDLPLPPDANAQPPSGAGSAPTGASGSAPNTVPTPPTTPAATVSPKPGG